jgi:hypothetical protein
MSLLALSLAAAVAATPQPAQAQQAAPMPNFYQPAAKCGPVGREVARQIRTATRGRMEAMYAVVRDVDGCMVPAPVGYRQDYLAPGKWDARPAGEPPRKR